MKEFYLMRHGQTRFNVQHRLQGVCDAPLTEVGIEQAKKAGQYLAKQEPIFDHVFTSTSERASDTLEIVTGRTDYERLKVLKDRILVLLKDSQSILLLKPYLIYKALVITLFNLVARVRPRFGIVWS
mgnify:CR=1 FL=1